MGVQTKRKQEPTDIDDQDTRYAFILILNGSLSLDPDHLVPKRKEQKRNGEGYSQRSGCLQPSNKIPESPLMTG